VLEKGSMHMYCIPTTPKGVEGWRYSDGLDMNEKFVILTTWYSPLLFDVSSSAQKVDSIK
jgi:hypothetical protein